MQIHHYLVKLSGGRVSGYRWRLVASSGVYQAVSDQRMGSVVAAQRELLRLWAQDHGQDIGDTGECSPSELILFDDITIEPMVTQPGVKVHIKSGEYEFTCYMDLTGEAMIACWSAVMKFFASKYGVIDLHPDVARNRDAALEMGFSA